MKSTFTLFQSHLDLAHAYWEKLILPKDIIVDATCGNGQDTLFLAKLCYEGNLYAFDIQAKAIELSRSYLAEHLDEKTFKNIQFFNQCHSNFPQEITLGTVKLIVYNLGYLPGQGNKSLTTLVETTFASIQKAMDLLISGGAICLTLYPGHEEGEKELIFLHNWVQSLDAKKWNCCLHQWPNRKKSPQLLLLQKAI
jgi:SAM-dependent methyltransferase